MKLTKNIIVGMSLIAVGCLVSVLFPYAGVALVMFFAALAAIGVYILLSKKDSRFSIWKMFGKATLSFAVLILLIAYGLTQSHDNTNKELAEYGKYATAIIVDKDAFTVKRRGQATTTYDVTFKFKPKGQAEREFTNDVGAPEYRVAYKGMAVKVHYSSRKPEVNKLIF